MKRFGMEDTHPPLYCYEKIWNGRYTSTTLLLWKDLEWKIHIHHITIMKRFGMEDTHPPLYCY